MSSTTNWCLDYLPLWNGYRDVVNDVNNNRRHLMNLKESEKGGEKYEDNNQCKMKKMELINSVV